MSRGSQILIGIILLLLSSVLLLMASIPGEQAFVPVRLLGALVTGLLGFACVFSWGRPLTTRISLGFLSLSMVGLIIYILASDKPELQPCIFAGFVAVTSGAYAVSGYYPEGFPMAQVFGREAPPAPPDNPEVEAGRGTALNRAEGGRE